MNVLLPGTSYFLPAGDMGGEINGVGSIPAAILLYRQHMKILHHNRFEMNKVG